jgi:hypothetical protein
MKAAVESRRTIEIYISGFPTKWPKESLESFSSPLKAAGKKFTSLIKETRGI